MRHKIKEQEPYVSQWRIWFAWYPVKVYNLGHHYWVWWEHVERYWCDVYNRDRTLSWDYRFIKND